MSLRRRAYSLPVNYTVAVSHHRAYYGISRFVPSVRALLRGLSVQPKFYCNRTVCCYAKRPFESFQLWTSIPWTFIKIGITISQALQTFLILLVCTHSHRGCLQRKSAYYSKLGPILYQSAPWGPTSILTTDVEPHLGLIRLCCALRRSRITGPVRRPMLAKGLLFKGWLLLGQPPPLLQIVKDL